MIFISKNLEFLRKKAGLKQNEVAEKLGVKSNTISNYEKGVSQPDYLIIKELMNIFSVSSDQLLFTDISTEWNKSSILINDESTNSIFEKFLSKIDERDRKIDEKDNLLKEKEIENKELFKENIILKQKLEDFTGLDHQADAPNVSTKISSSRRAKNAPSANVPSREK